LCVRLEGDDPTVEKFEMLLNLAVGRDFLCGTTLVPTTQFTSGLYPVP
jgi:hypothetical protein